MAPKKQQNKMSIGDFLKDESLGSWADEMDSMPMPAPSGFGSRPSAGSWSANRGAPGAGAGAGAGAADTGAGGFGGASRLAGYAVREQLPLPDKPPYTAHLGNLSFEVTEADVQDFFSGCEVTSVRIVEDKLDRRPKGFGYIEFGTVEGLKKALTLSDSQFQGRNIRVSVADPPKDREPTRVIDDWSRKGPLPDLPGRGAPARGSSFRGGFDAGASDAGSERGGRREMFNQGDGKVRDFGNWERKGPLTPAEPSPRGGEFAPRGERPARTERADGGFRDRQAGWGEGTGRTAEDYESRPRREFTERSERPPPVERQPTAADMDNQWRTKMKPDAPSPAETPDDSTPTSPAAPAAPASRPRLNLAKRTVTEGPPSAEAGASNEAKGASIFGAARPIDTAARDREVEEKRELAIRQKKEQQDKDREERRASAAAAKEQQPKEKVTSPTERSARNAQPKQSDKNTDSAKDESAPAQFEILRRGENDEEAEGEADEDNANGDIIGDKDVKPQEITREAPKSQNSWRKPSTTEEPETTAETMEDDGWSTISKKEKKFNNRRGGGNVGGSSRALAS